MNESMPAILWMCDFLNAQGYPLRPIKVHQDNLRGKQLETNGRTPHSKKDEAYEHQTLQPNKKRERRLARRNTTAKAILRQINKVELTVLRAINLSNDITNELKKKEPWKNKLSIH